jgi:hypothetical protein
MGESGLILCLLVFHRGDLVCERAYRTIPSKEVGVTFLEAPNGLRALALSQDATRSVKHRIHCCGVRGCAHHRPFENLLGMSARMIQVRPSRNPRWQKQGGWEVFEAEGVSPVYGGNDGRQSALSYAQQRAGYGRCEIHVLDQAWSITDTISNEDLKPLV